MDEKDKPVKIGDNYYFTVKQFGRITNRTTQDVYMLCTRGNRYRKLKREYFGEKPYIPVNELTDFPFAPSGPSNPNNVYHFDADGHEIKAVINKDKE